MTEFVPDDFEVPRTASFELFRLEALGPGHNERDHDAWSNSMEHIHATFGFEGHPWPHPMSLAENLADMEMHAREFDERVSFTWSILDGDEVIGCVYLYPCSPPRSGQGRFRSWVTASRAPLDEPVRDALDRWFEFTFPIDVDRRWNDD